MSIRKPVRRAIVSVTSWSPASSTSSVRPQREQMTMVVVGGLAADVGVLTRRQVEPLHDPQLDEQLEGPEDRRPPDPQASPPGVRLQLRGREGPGPTGW